LRHAARLVVLSGWYTRSTVPGRIASGSGMALRRMISSACEVSHK
jgi:hypothetical protein